MTSGTKALTSMACVYLCW